MVSLAYRHRAAPIAWTWVKQVRGHSSGRQQLALLKYVKGLLPKKLEITMLRHFSRLSRLTLAIAFLYVWLLSNGGKFIQVGLRHLVDRTDRRDLSLFQIGLRLIERRLLNLQSY